MEEQAAIKSVEALLETAPVKKAQCLEICIIDAIHFRLNSPSLVAELVEQHLLPRDADQFQGYAKARREIENSMSRESLQKKIEACCIRYSKWVPDRQILYSMELQAWMDISYPNPWILELYHQARSRGISIRIPIEGPFSRLFSQLLLQKNGYEQLLDPGDQKTAVKVLLGPPHPHESDILYFQPEIPPSLPHALADGDSVSQALANGVLVKDREESFARSTDPLERCLHEVGYRWIGPTLVLVFQSLAQRSNPVSFHGLGSGFLSTLALSLAQPWPWLPEFSASASNDNQLSLFPDPKSSLSLLPSIAPSDSPSILTPDACSPSHLILPPMTAFFLAAFKGPQAARIQTSAASFVQDFARITRGWQPSLPADVLLQEWRHQLLSPNSDFLEIIRLGKVLPGWTGGGSIWPGARAVKAGTWPTGSYVQSGKLRRYWLGILAPARVRAIRERLGSAGR